LSLIQSIKTIEKNFDFVVVGGGLAGVCAAISAARQGLSVALINNRPVLGGNASSEVGLLVASADRDFHHARETGIIEEINLENRFRNHEMSYSNYNMDLILWAKVNQAGVHLFMNTNIDTLEMQNETQIKFIVGTQLGTEKKFCFIAPLFVDCSGDGILLALSGAEFKRGTESKFEFNEALAPDIESHITQGSTLMFRTKNLGRPTRFIRPEWAYHFPKAEDLPHKVQHTDGGFLWIEYGAKLDTISDNEEIRDELWKILYGVWDHLKNHGNYGMDNEELAWVANWPGKRESRRGVGDYILTQNDITNPTEYEDAVAYGGWPCDVHNPEGFWAKEKWLNYLHLSKVYPIPYRCYYSKNISNLFIGGRLTSATHIAHGSTRVMATCAVGGQAIGTAAALCKKYKVTPRELGQTRIKELQQLLLKEDCFIPEATNEDANDLARIAKVSSPSQYRKNETEEFHPNNVISGVSRGNSQKENLWMSNQKCSAEPWELTFEWEFIQNISSVRLTFDTMIREKKFFVKTVLGPLPTCVRSYRILTEEMGGAWKEIKTVKGNYLRHNIVNFDLVQTKKIKIIFDETNGDTVARVYEIRMYA
jgi:hypothetical protein